MEGPLAGAGIHGVPASLSSTALAFLRTELASTPRRQRATLRITLACVIAAALVAGFHIPEGHWLIITVLMVSQPDAGESLLKGIRPRRRHRPSCARDRGQPARGGAGPRTDGRGVRSLGPAHADGRARPAARRAGL